MTWPLASLLLGLLALIIVAYAVWAQTELDRARDKRAALRLEMERGAVETFSKAIETLQQDVRTLKLEQRAAAVRR